MSSDYERIVKLWISLWTLILDKKRHLETALAFLQKLVFEEHGYPGFKNWPEICKLGKTHHLMMMAVATVDLSKDDEVTQQIIAAFPQCFSYEEVRAPFPLSLIRAAAEEEGSNQGNSCGAMYPVSFSAIPKHIPIQTFDIHGNQIVCGCRDEPLPILPEGIDPNSPQNSIVVWEGKRFVVLENNTNCEEMHLAPAECIALDL